MADTGKPQQHTPGPWEVDARAKPIKVCGAGPHGGLVADVSSWWYSTEQAAANAALIAAAPELLAALVALDAGLATQAESDGHAAGLRRIARAAIAAATDRLPAERSEQATEGGTP
jgi:hypothetical protein